MSLSFVSAFEGPCPDSNVYEKCDTCKQTFFVGPNVGWKKSAWSIGPCSTYFDVTSMIQLPFIRNEAAGPGTVVEQFEVSDYLDLALRTNRSTTGNFIQINDFYREEIVGKYVYGGPEVTHYDYFHTSCNPNRVTSVVKERFTHKPDEMLGSGCYIPASCNPMYQDSQSEDGGELALM
ncbi:MAG: hypothetical protein S4CHLAM6_11600 [Chlamydiae bacterium]|nr:hypothetical protein [Chlamydiota bacterium]